MRFNFNLKKEKYIKVLHLNNNCDIKFNSTQNSLKLQCIKTTVNTTELTTFNTYLINELIGYIFTCVCIVIDQITVSKDHSHAVTSSVTYYSTHGRNNVNYLFYTIIIQMFY